MKIKLLITAIIGLLLISGCMTFVDKNLKGIPEHEIAILHDENILFAVLEVDGNSTHHAWWPTNTFKLSPGEHSIQVKWSHYQYKTTPSTRWIKAEPGKEYKIQGAADTTAMKWNFRVVDISTDEPVDYIK